MACGPSGGACRGVRRRGQVNADRPRPCLVAAQGGALPCERLPVRHPDLVFWISIGPPEICFEPSSLRSNSFAGRRIEAIPQCQIIRVGLIEVTKPAIAILDISFAQEISKIAMILRRDAL